MSAIKIPGLIDFIPDHHKLAQGHVVLCAGSWRLEAETVIQAGEVKLRWNAYINGDDDVGEAFDYLPLVALQKLAVNLEDRSIEVAARLKSASLEVSRYESLSAIYRGLKKA